MKDQTEAVQMEMTIPVSWKPAAAGRGIKKRIRSMKVYEELEIEDNTWIVLYRNEQERTAELLSKDCVATRAYDRGVTGNWKDSEIRRWLLEAYRDTLPEELQKLTREVYLLSEAQYQEYESRFAGELCSYGIEGDNDYNWWLRTACGRGYAKYVSYIRGNTDYAMMGQRMGIRPAITVTYK